MRQNDSDPQQTQEHTTRSTRAKLQQNTGALRLTSRPPAPKPHIRGPWTRSNPPIGGTATNTICKAPWQCRYEWYQEPS